MNTRKGASLLPRQYAFVIAAGIVVIVAAFLIASRVSSSGKPEETIFDAAGFSEQFPTLIASLDNGQLRSGPAHTGSKQGVCLAFGSAASGELASCGAALSAGDATHEGGLVFGAVDAQTRSVVIRYVGRVVTVPTTAAPIGLHTDFRFFVGWEKAAGQALGYDELNQERQTTRVISL